MGRRIVITALAGALTVGAAGCGDADDTGGQTGRESRVAAALPGAIPERKSAPRSVEPEAGASGVDVGVEAAPVEEDVPVDAAVRSTDDGVDLSRQRAMKVDAGGGGDAIRKATVIDGGIALPPLDAPDEVRKIIESGNQIARTPYLWGGGHGKWLDKGYDCSGSVSYALASAGLLNAPLASGPFMNWGKPGKGKWITIYTNPGHMFMVVAGVRFDTSGRKVTGSRWQNSMRSGGSFVLRHPPGL